MIKNNDNLQKIEKRLALLQQNVTPVKSSYNNNKNNSFSIAIELVSGVISGAIIGVVCDKIFATHPWFLLSCLIIGMLASVHTIWRHLDKK